MSRISKLVVLSAMAVGIALTLAGCSAPSEPTTSATAAAAAAAKTDLAPDDIIVLAGVSANQPRAQLPVQVQPVIEAGVRAHAPITVISVDGTPAVSFHAAGYQINTKNTVAEQDDVNSVQSALLDAVARAKADSDGSNLSAAFAIAGDQAKADGAKRAIIIVVDSGLSDSGYPNLTTPGITEIKPAAVMNFAAQHQEIPTMPAGTAVYLTGIGYGAGRQAQLTSNQRSVVTAIWRGMLEKAGTRVQVIPNPRTGAIPKTKYIAGIVIPAELAQFSVEREGNAVHASLSSDVLFQPDKWDLLPTANLALEQLVKLLKKSSGTVTTKGFTDIGATSVPGGLIALSQHRADAVKAYLVDHGIASTRISAVGEGAGGTTTASPNNRRVTVDIEQTAQP